MRTQSDPSGGCFAKVYKEANGKPPENMILLPQRKDLDRSFAERCLAEWRLLRIEDLFVSRLHAFYMFL